MNIEKGNSIGYLRKLKNISVVNFGIFLSSIFSFLTHVYIGREFGLTKLSDSFFLAFSIIETFSKILFISQFSHLSLVIFWDEYEREKDSAWIFLGNIYSILILLCVFFLGFSVVFGKVIVRIFGPGFSEETIENSARILPFMFIYLFANFSCILSEMIINKFSMFFVSSIVHVLRSGSVFFIFIALKDRIGIFSIVLGYVISELIFSVVLLRYVIRCGFGIRHVKKFNSKMLRKYFGNLGTFFFSNLAVFLTGFSYKFSVSFLPSGSISILYYSRRIFVFIANITWSGASKVIFPDFVEHRRTKRQIQRILFFSSLFIVITGLFILAVFYIWGDEILLLIFGRGKMNKQDIDQIWTVLIIYLISYIPDGINNLIGHLFISMQKNSLVANVNIISAVLHSALFFLMSKIYGYYGIAMTPTIVLTVMIAIYLVNLRKILGRKE